MTYSKWEYQNIVLASIAQCGALVERLATQGNADDLSVQVCVAPLLDFSPGSIAEIYPNISQLSIGLRTLQDIFDSARSERNSEIIRYVLGILALRQKLMGDNAMQGKVQNALKSIDPLVLSDTVSSTDLETHRFYKEIATAYQGTISTYSFRIHVKGNMEYLKDELIANKIRALLLAGIRAAVLWYQIGGRRWHLILYRKKINQTSRQIRKSLITTV